VSTRPRPRNRAHSRAGSQLHSLLRSARACSTTSVRREVAERATADRERLRIAGGSLCNVVQSIRSADDTAGHIAPASRSTRAVIRRVSLTGFYRSLIAQAGTTSLLRGPPTLTPVDGVSNLVHDVSTAKTDEPTGTRRRPVGSRRPIPIGEPVT